MSDIEQAARELARAQECFDECEQGYLEGKATLLDLKAASGAAATARWKLRKAHTEARAGQEATA
jgi:hypothetical protein